jgi:hypothetical protein
MMMQEMGGGGRTMEIRWSADEIAARSRFHFTDPDLTSTMDA